VLNIPGIEPQHPSWYQPDFITKKQADDLFDACKALPKNRPKTKLSGYKSDLLRLEMPFYVGVEKWIPSATENQWKFLLKDAPSEIQALAKKLSAIAGRPINYLSLNGYENERDVINWHQHREDDCRDATVYIVSLGEKRTFGLRPFCEKGRLCSNGDEAVCNGGGCLCKVCVAARAHRKLKLCKKACSAVCKRIHKHRTKGCQKTHEHVTQLCEVCHDKSKWEFVQPAHGSLITLRHDFNATHAHAVLDDSGTEKKPIKKCLRISINTKHIPPEDTLKGNIYIPKEHMHAPIPKTEVVHCKKEAYDVYIGKVNGTPGKKGYLPESKFANRSGGDYESYFRKKLRNELGFAAEVMKLHSKRLGCWCKDTSRDFSKCHGHIVAKWADLIHDKWQQLKPDKIKMREWLKHATEEGGE
jgi:hypothetical protein